MAQEENKLVEVKPLLIKGKDGYWRKQRQKHSHEKKLQVVAEALTPGASVSAVARKHGVNTNLIFSWIPFSCKFYFRGKKMGLRRFLSKQFVDVIQWTEERLRHACLALSLRRQGDPERLAKNAAAG